MASHLHGRSINPFLRCCYSMQEERTKKVLKRFKDHNLFLKLEKCIFTAEEVEFLGLIVGHKGIRMDSAKVSVIKKWDPPTTVKQVRSFLGFCNYYRRFIP